MTWVALLAGALLVPWVLWEAFETIVLPRRVTRRFRFTRVFYRAIWTPWRAVGARVAGAKGRETFLSIYGPISLLLLLVAWGAILIFAFALMHWGAGSHLQAPAGLHGFAVDLYFSGATLFTLSLGDINPISPFERLLTVLEGGTGLGFLAMVIGYLPVISQAFSRREVNITLLDARAASPPSAGEILVRHAGPQGAQVLDELLRQWERWSAELLEAHISYPVLGYWRSQHDNQSWISALTTILDVSALIVASLDQEPTRPGRLTFAMARHAAVDLSTMYRLPPRPPDPDRLPPAEMTRLRRVLAGAGVELRQGPDVDEKLNRLRGMYEPYLYALGEFLLMPLPAWLGAEGTRDNWLSTL